MDVDIKTLKRWRDLLGGPDLSRAISIVRGELKTLTREKCPVQEGATGIYCDLDGGHQDRHHGIYDGRIGRPAAGTLMEIRWREYV